MKMAMKKTVLILLAGLSLLLNPKGAGAAPTSPYLWNGIWEGPGTISIDRKEPEDCEPFQIEIAKEGDTLRFPKGLGGCARVSSFRFPVTFRLQDEDVYIEDLKIGRLEPVHLTINFKNLQDDYEEIVELEYDEEGLHYRNTVFVVEGGVEHTVTNKGVLQRVPLDLR